MNKPQDHVFCSWVCGEMFGHLLHVGLCWFAVFIFENVTTGNRHIDFFTMNQDMARVRLGNTYNIILGDTRLVEVKEGGFYIGVYVHYSQH